MLKKTNKYTNYSFSLLIMYGSSYMFRHYISIIWERSEICSIEEQSIEYFGWAIATYHVTRHNTTIHNILSTAPQLSISHKALGTLPEDDNVMPKHIGATTHN
jgi:hypothetical protein